MKDSKVLFLVFATIMFVTCTSKPPKRAASEAVSLESKQLASEEESNYVTEISFSRASAKLSESSRAKLAAIFNEAKNKGKVVEAKVVTWADREYPSVHTEKLTKKEILLVDNRNKNIEKYLHDLNSDVDVELFSMAQRPSTMSKLFSTENARIKKSLETAGVPNTDTTVKVPGKASKAIVILITEDQKL